MRLSEETVRLSRLPRTGVSDEDAARLALNHDARENWMLRHSLASNSPEALDVMGRGWDFIIALDELAESAPKPQPAAPRPLAPAHALRPDTESLRAFVACNPWIGGRQREIFDLCVQQGVSLSECAAKLGVSRETVRSHLRRLRQSRAQAR